MTTILPSPSGGEMKAALKALWRQKAFLWTSYSSINSTVMNGVYFSLSLLHDMYNVHFKYLYIRRFGVKYSYHWEGGNSFKKKFREIAYCDEMKRVISFLHIRWSSSTVMKWNHPLHFITVDDHLLWWNEITLFISSQ